MKGSSESFKGGRNLIGKKTLSRHREQKRLSLLFSGLNYHIIRNC